MNLHKLKEAENCFNRALALRSNEPATLNNLGTCMMQQNGQKKPGSFFKPDLARASRDLVLLGNAGLALSQLGNYDKAIKYLKDAIKRGSREISVLNNLGVCLLRRVNIRRRLIFTERFLQSQNKKAWRLFPILPASLPKLVLMRKL